MSVLPQRQNYTKRSIIHLPRCFKVSSLKTLDRVVLSATDVTMATTFDAIPSDSAH